VQQVGLQLDDAPRAAAEAEPVASASVPDVQLPYELPGPLRTERLVLRHMTVDDVDDIYAYQSREDVCRYLPFEPRTREQVVEKVTKFSTALELRGDGDFWQLAVEEADAPGRVIGDVYFTIKNLESAGGEIGWTLHPDAVGRGYMTEAATAVLDVAFQTIGLHRVMANLDPRNAASAALCERLGMRREASFVEDLWFKGEWAGTAIYAILDREWLASREAARTSSPPRPAARS
jgi:RimJ/RimL family protein N-acetyltransferase